MEIVENSPIGSYVPDIIQGVDYTDFLEVYKDKNLKRSYRRTYCNTCQREKRCLAIM